MATETMRAWVYKTAGPPSAVLKEEKEWQRPALKNADDLLVQMVAASINPVDWKLMENGPMAMLIKKPAIVGMDFSGIVLDGGSEALERFPKGAEVYGKIPSKAYNTGRSGSFAEFIVVPSSQVVLKPGTVTMEEASGIVLAGLTAWQSLNYKTPLKAADRVLILGGSGGVGTFAVQEAKARGCYVVATCSAKNAAQVKSLGADEVIDYTAVPDGDMSKHLTESYGKMEETKFDRVLDGVGQMDLYNKCKSFTKDQAVYVTYGAGASSYYAAIRDSLNYLKAAYFGVKGRTHKMLLLDDEPKSLQELADLVSSGKVTPLIDSIHDWDDALKVLERSLSHRSVGKIIIKAPRGQTAAPTSEKNLPDATVAQ